MVRLRDRIGNSLSLPYELHAREEREQRDDGGPEGGKGDALSGSLAKALGDEFCLSL